MALGAVLAAALTDHSAREFGLYIDGLDVVLQPGQQGNGYGTLVETVHITESGPGQVSSMTFEIDDPLNVVAVSEGARVLFHNLSKDVTDFAGFVETARVIAGATGRTISVTCVGMEVLLDWYQVAPALTIPFLTTARDAIQAIVSAAISTGVGINTNWAAGGNTYATPFQGSAGISLGRDVTVSGTLRQCLRTVADALMEAYPSGYEMNLTLDFLAGLRVGVNDSSTWGISGVTLNVSTSSTPKPANAEHSPIQGDAVRAVYVTGGNAAGSGLVPDGSGEPGAVATINDADLLSTSARDAAASAYMVSQGQGSTGSFQLESYAQTAGMETAKRVWSILTYTHVTLGLTNYHARMQSIDKRYDPSGDEWWTVTYGNRSRLGAQEIRALTG